MARQVCKIFIGGGGDARIIGIVRDYSAKFIKNNPGMFVQYFGHGDWFTGKIRRNLAKIPSSTHLTMVGHSYGAHECFQALMRTGRVADVLISIDPVGRTGYTAWSEIRPYARRWLNVRAENRLDVGDGFALLGGKYGPPPPHADGGPDYARSVDTVHGAFQTMMRAAGDGSPSGELMLLNRF